LLALGYRSVAKHTQRSMHASSPSLLTYHDKAAPQYTVAR
jgi:hypothetical protein